MGRLSSNNGMDRKENYVHTKTHALMQGVGTTHLVGVSK
jgi:hypothetical protein